jgi:hypothetical protein
MDSRNSRNIHGLHDDPDLRGVHTISKAISSLDITLQSRLCTRFPQTQIFQQTSGIQWIDDTSFRAPKDDVENDQVLSPVVQSEYFEVEHQIGVGGKCGEIVDSRLEAEVGVAVEEYQAEHGVGGRADGSGRHVAWIDDSNGHSQ